MSSLDCVRIVESIFAKIWAVISPAFIRIWPSLGGARCPGALYGVGTPQDCIDHMRRAHTVPAMVKAANLARWFPPWTVSRERWSTVLSTSVSGVATDTLLFSRIGVLLVHRYRVFSLACIPDVSGGSGGGTQSGVGRFISAQYVSSPVFSVPGIYVGCCRCFGIFDSCRGSFTPVPSGCRAVPVPIDLALPRFAASSENPEQRTEVTRDLRSRWVATQESQASPSPLTSPSLCLNLDTLSSDESAGLWDVSAHPICISDVSSHSGDLDQVLSGDDLPSSVHVDLVSPASPTVSARVQQSLSHYSPPAAPLTLSAEYSAPMSPNRVRSDCTTGTLDAGPVFEVLRTLRVFFLGQGILPCRPHQ